jgi:hypothetical protein
MKRTVLACFLAISLLACDDSTELDTVNTLGTDVQFSMVEYLEPGQRTLSFKFLTVNDYPCINYRIASELRREGSNITVSLREIQGADVCLEAVAPAASFLDIGELSPGEYPITIEVGASLANHGTLLITEEAIELLLGQTDGLIVPTPRMLRVPEGLIWGAVRASAEHAGADSQFMQRLRSLGTAPKTLSEGDYGYFSVDAVGNVKPSSLASDQDNLFVLGFRGETRNLQQLVNETADAYGHEVTVSLRTSRGDEFRN